MKGEAMRDKLRQFFKTAEPGERWKLLVLIFMVSLFPLVIIPGDRTGFTLPKYVVLAVAAALVLCQALNGRVKVKEPALIPLAAFALFALISTITASEPLNAWFGFYRYTGFCTYLYCMLLFLAAADFSEPEKIVPPMAATAALVSVVALLQYLGLNFIPHYYHQGLHTYATIGNQNFMGSYTVFVLPAAVYFYLRRRKVFWLGCAALIYAGLLVTMTRGAWLAAPLPLLLLLGYFFRERANRKYVVILCLVLLLVTALLAPLHDWLLVKRALSIQEQVTLAVTLEDAAGSSRLYIWKEALKLIPEHWAFGVGPDNLNIALGPGYYADKAHNIYIEVAVTMGLLALAAYLAFLSFFMRRWKNELGFLLFLMILTYLIQGFFNIDVVAVMPLFWITLGLFVANRRSRARAAALQPPG